MKLSIKITMLICILALSIGGLTTWLAARLISDTLSQRFEEEGRFIARSLSESLNMPVIAGEVSSVTQTLRNVVAENPDINYVFITDFEKRLFAHSFADGFPKALIPHLQEAGDRISIDHFQTGEGDIIHISLPMIEGLAARLHIGLNDKLTQARIRQLGLTLTTLATLITLIAVAAGALISRHISQPLSRLTRLMESYGRGESIPLDTLPLTQGGYEVTRLYEAFLAMVAEREEALAKIRRSEQSLAEAQRVARLGSWDWNIENGSLYWSDEIYRIFGLTPQAFGATYEAFLERVHPDDREAVIEAVNRAIGPERIPYGIDHRIIRPDGEIRIVHEQAEVHRNDAGEATHMIGTVQDITERKLAEEELEKHRHHLQELVEERTTELKQRETELKALTRRLQASNKELEAFSYSVSHDLRSPLRAIDGFSLALLEDYESQLDETGRDYLQRVRKGAQKMSTLIDDLLQLSRVTRNELRPRQVDLSRLAENIIEELRDAEPQRPVEVAIEAGLTTEGDPALLDVLFRNLLGNAWKFSRHQQPARIEVSQMSKDGQQIFFIRDNGVGFNMKYADKLFTAFQRLHGLDQFEGTGIGLATVQRVINRHNGEIWVEAAEGKGATFYFTLTT